MPHYRYIILPCIILLTTVLALQTDTFRKADPMHNNATYIPRQVIFSDPSYTAVRISPDGNYISYIAPKDGIKNIYIAPRNQPDAAYPITNDTHRGITKYCWAYDNTHILYLQDNDGDENWRIYAVNINTSESHLLTPGNNIRAEFEHLTHKDPSHILVGLNDRRPDYHDLYRLNIHTGDITRVFQNDHYTEVVTDDQFNVRFGKLSSSDGGNIIYRINQETPEEHTATVFKTVPPEQIFNTDIVMLDSDHEILYLLESDDRDTNALYAYNLVTDSKQFIHADARSDISNILFHPQEHHVQAVENCYLRSEWHVLDTNLTSAFETLTQLHPDADIAIVSRSLDDTTWIVAYICDTHSTQYYVLDRNANTLTHLCDTKPEINAYTLSSMQPVEIQTRDGYTLPSYLTIPADQTAHDDGFPQQPLPLVLLVHGGPHTRDSWGPHPIHQWLASRGYAVLSVNYRQSVGFGKNLAQAGFGEWAGKMHTDLLDAVDWAINRGITQKDKVAIMGGSYGGYATLVGLTMTPDIFACGIDIVGPSNLVTLLNSMPEYWKPKRAFFIRLTGGDPDTQKGKAILDEKSPINYVDSITKPLLIAQGANDPRVKQAESDQIVHAMQDKNIPVTYAVYPDEGHGFVKANNKISFFAIAEQFLHEQLGGQYEPIHDEIEQSSVHIQAGQVT